jgi:predicted enzyme related to lactoylglutathione lyase
MNPVKAFNIPAHDMQKACQFCKSVFDWNVKEIVGSGGNYHFAVTTPSDEDGEPLSKGAINGGLFQKGTHGINETFLELTVESIDSCVKRAISMGGRKISEKKLMASSFYFAIIQDPEGNYLGLWEEIKVG